MLLSKTAIVKWNSKIYKHYTDLGYQYTGKGTPFETQVEDLTPYSHALVSVRCDYCGKIFQISWYGYKRGHTRISQKDACGDVTCYEIKAKESLIEKYGSLEKWSEMVLEKSKKTNLERYGHENPFANEQVKEKIANIRNDIFEQYGQYRTPESVDKAKATCIEKWRK